MLFCDMQAVLGLVEDHRLRPVHDLGRHFFAAVRRQAMHEHGIAAPPASSAPH